MRPVRQIPYNSSVPKKEFQYIVLGLGGLGSAAAYWLARRAGTAVLGLEQFELGHARGGSHDHSRIIRLSYHKPNYVQLAKRAYSAWAQLEADSGETVIIKTGGLDLAPVNSAIPIIDYTNSLTAARVPFEFLDAPELRRRYPQWRVEDDVMALYQPDGGIAAAERATAAHQRMARVHGATLRDGAPVQSVRPLAAGYEVQAGGETYRCEKLVVANGAWTNHTLAHLGIKLPLTVTQEQANYFSVPDAAEFAPERFPVWIWMDEPSYYGFPVFGTAGVKVAQDCGGAEVTAETRTFDRDEAAYERVSAFTKRYLPGAHGPLLYSKSCLYCMPPDRDFIVDVVPGHERCAIAVGAGHAFKFASVLGQILSELAIDGSTPSDIAGFSMQRPILWMDNPPRSFMQ